MLDVKGNMFLRGIWAFCPEYQIGDVAWRAGAFYVCITDCAGKDPIDPLSADYWEIVGDDSGGGDTLILWHGTDIRVTQAHVDTRTDLPDPLVIGRLYYIADEGRIVLDMGGGAEEYGSGDGAMHYLGKFDNEAALVAAYPIGDPGGFASVTATGTLWFWNDDTKVWEDSETPAAFVKTVQGKSGPDVTLTPADIGAEDASKKGAVNGYPGLDSGGKIPADQLPVIRHSQLSERDAVDQHPMSAITGLVALNIAQDQALASEITAREDADADLQGKIDAVTGKLRYLPTNDFGTATPAQTDLTAYAKSHTGLDNVGNSTSVTNAFDGHEWIYNSEADEWVDNGLGSVTTAKNGALGVVQGDAVTPGNVKVNPDGTQTVNNAVLSPNATVKNIITITQADYDALETKDTATLYAVDMGGWYELYLGATSYLPGDAEVGDVVYTTASTPRTGTVKANGTALNRVTYGRLFRKIGTTYGAGNGSTTFNVPDLRGEFLRGWNDGRGVDAGRVFGSAQGDAIRNVTGYAIFYTPFLADFAGVFNVTARSNSLAPLTANGDISQVSFDASRVVPTANENRPRNVALLACIKY